MKCDNCHSEMTKVSRERILGEMPEDVTDGQMADYLAAQESGDFGEWGYTEIKFKCKKCGSTVSIIED